MKRLTINQAAGLAVQKMIRAGIPEEQAAVAAPLYLEGELVGRPAHGLRHLFNNLKQWELGASGRKPLAILNETPVSALVAGGNQHAYFVNWTGMQKSIEKARQSGVGMVAVREGGGSGVVGAYARAVTEAGFISLILSTSPASVVPFGGKRAILGTNPVAIGIPRRNAPPIILDMATSAGTFNQILLARMTGKNLPEGIALNARGEQTITAQEALDENGRSRLLPLAGHKGFGLSLAIEILAACGAGSMIGLQTGPVHNPDYFSALYISYRPDLFINQEEFDQRVEKLLADTLAVELAAGHTEIRIPGEASARKRAETLERGYIDIEEATFEFLTEA